VGNTKKGRDVRLADRWLAANGGGLPPLNPGAHALLGARLVARRRALLISSPLLLVAAALMVSILLAGLPESIDSRHSYAVRYLLIVVVIGVTLLLSEGLSSRADRRLTAGLACHVTRGRRVPVRELLGTRVTRAAIVMLAAAIALGVAVIVADRGGWLTWAFLGGGVATAGLNATRLYRISTRPTLAVDPTALAVDERLRADDAVNAVRTLVPITMIPFGQVMPSASQPNSWVWFCWMAGSLVIVTTWIWAAMEPRWPGSPIAGWPPSRDGGTAGDPVALPSAGPGAGPWSGGEGR
jgi:hypothetical protein